MRLLRLGHWLLPTTEEYSEFSSITITTCGVAGGADGCDTVSVALPDFAESWVLVAVMVTLPPEEAAVNTPLADMLPALAAHLTAEL